MTTKPLKAIIIILIFSTLSFADKPDLIWLTADIPPYSIVAGKYKGMGCGDYMGQLVKNAMPEYEHIKMVANAKRIFHELKKNEMVLCPTLLKTKDREKIFYYSIPYTILLPNNLVYLKEKEHLFKPYITNGKIDLEMMLKKSSLITGKSVGRTYNPYIDKLINDKKYEKKIKIYYKNFFQNAFKDVIKGYLDSMIGYPSEANFFLKDIDEKKEIVTVPFKETKAYTLGYFVLPKTKWGKKTLKIVNSVLKKNRNTKEFHKVYEFWLDKRSRKLYRKYVREVYRSN